MSCPGTNSPVILSNSVPKVVIKPVFFVPNSASKDPYFDFSEQDKIDLLKSLQIAKNFYAQQLGGKTFSFINNVQVYRSTNTNDYFASGKTNSPDTFHRIIDELLESDNQNRCNSEYVYLVIYWRSDDNGYQVAGGRTFNGGPQTGGGGVYVDLYDFKTNPWFLSTLVHELGHSFGLLHCNNHGEYLDSGQSIMCYTASHHSIDKFTFPNDPGNLSEEDKFLLSLNQDVFPTYSFTPSRTLKNVSSVDQNSPPYLWPMDNPIMSGVHASGYYQVCDKTPLIHSCN